MVCCQLKKQKQKTKKNKTKRKHFFLLDIRLLCRKYPCQIFMFRTPVYCSNVFSRMSVSRSRENFLSRLLLRVYACMEMPNDKNAAKNDMFSICVNSLQSVSQHAHNKVSNIHPGMGPLLALQKLIINQEHVRGYADNTHIAKYTMTFRKYSYHTVSVDGLYYIFNTL